MKIKKLLISMMFLFMCIPFLVNAETCDANKIIIDSVIIKNQDENVLEIEQPIIEGNKIKLDLKMEEVGDSIEYKLLLKNDSNEDYELDKNSFSNISDYIEYILYTEDNSLIVKSGQTKDVYLKVQYKNEVPDTAYSDGKFNDNKSFTLNLSNQQINDEVKNPKTGYSLVIIIILTILCLSISYYLYLNKKNYNKLMILILSLLIIIPSSVYALCKIQIKIDSNVLIENGPKKYEIGYLITSNNYLYTDEELAKCQKTPDTKCRDVYIGDVKYNNCSNIIIKDENKYEAGDIAFLNSHIDRHFESEDCTSSEDGTLNCPSCDVFESTNTHWYYDSLFKYSDYTYGINDNTAMNFSGYKSDHWEEGYLVLYSPQSFTMPAHNVLFSAGAHIDHGPM